MASVAPDVVVSGTVVAAPPGGVVVGTVVGATGHPALLALPPGVEYVRAQNVPFAPLLPTDTRGKPRVDDRRVISGIVHVLKSGGRWVDAPAVYGPRKTLYNRFVRWAAKGVWTDIFHALSSAGGPPAEVLIDSSAVKAHRCASGGKGGN